MRKSSSLGDDHDARGKSGFIRIVPASADDFYYTSAV
jgi:hypothetical protein